MIQPGIEPRSPGPLANTLLIRPMIYIYVTTFPFRRVLMSIMATHIVRACVQRYPFAARSASTLLRRTSDHSKLSVRPMIYIYIYIYIKVSLTLGFMHFAIVRQSRDLKINPNNMVNFFVKKKMRVICVYVCLSLCIIECYCTHEQQHLHKHIIIQ